MSSWLAGHSSLPLNADLSLIHCQSYQTSLLQHQLYGRNSIEKLHNTPYATTRLSSNLSTYSLMVNFPYDECPMVWPRGIWYQQQKAVVYIYQRWNNTLMLQCITIHGVSMHYCVLINKTFSAIQEDFQSDAFVQGQPCKILFLHLRRFYCCCKLLIDHEYFNTLINSNVWWHCDAFGIMHWYSCTLYCPISTSTILLARENTIDKCIDEEHSQLNTYRWYTVKSLLASSVPYSQFNVDFLLIMSEVTISSHAHQSEVTLLRNCSKKSFQYNIAT